MRKVLLRADASAHMMRVLLIIVVASVDGARHNTSPIHA